MSAPPKVDELYAEACACIEQGLCYDEIDDSENALIFYERSLNLMKEAEKEKHYKKSDMYKTMMDGKKKVEKRMKDLEKERAKGVSPEKKKRNEEDEKLKADLKKHVEAAPTVEADLIFYIPDGVQLFIIEGENTTMPTYPSSLEIFRFNSDQRKPEGMQADAFIQVGPWSYPLVPGQTPVLKNDFGAYVVPNPLPDHPDTFVGILLPKDIDPKDEEDFCSILKEHTEMKTFELARSLSKEEREHLSRKIGDLLMEGGEYLAANIQKVAEKTSKIVVDHSSRIRSSLTPGDKPMHVTPMFAVNKIGDMGMAVGRTLASSAEKHLGDGEGGIVGGTIYILGSGITSASTVWIALENASKTMAKNIADETVDTVRHKWGDQASLTAHEALYATGHTSLAALQLWDLGPRSVAGRAARKAGVQFVTDLHKKRSNSSIASLDKKNS